MLSILIGSLIAFMPEIQEQIQQKPVRYILVSMSFELLMFTTISWIFGMQRIPANYLSLIFLRFYVFFDCQYYERIQKPAPAEKIDLSWYNFWSGKEPEEDHCCSDYPYEALMFSGMYAEKCLFAALILAMTGLVTVYSKIDISRCEWLAISLIAVGTSLSTVILISSMAIERLGRDQHCTLCKTWTIIAFVAAIFTFVFATQRMYKRISGKMLSNTRYYRTQAELLIFAINVCVVVYYIPVIHPGFSFYRTIVSFPGAVATVTPRVVRKLARYLQEDAAWLMDKIRPSV
jgi:hypothetical protein